MKLSARAKRMDRRHKRQVVATISLVSLMDIFTILVFFLLVNSSSTYQLPPNKSIVLPTSNAEQLPKETLTLMVTSDSLLVNSQKVGDVSAILATTGETIPALANELRYQASRTAPANVNEQGQPERDVTIMGHKEIPYQLLKRIMATCSANEYTRIALAVTRKEGS
jgi:biopolymer transport protein TolR